MLGTFSSALQPSTKASYPRNWRTKIRTCFSNLPPHCLVQTGSNPITTSSHVRSALRDSQNTHTRLQWRLGWIPTGVAVKASPSVTAARLAAPCSPARWPKGPCNFPAWRRRQHCVRRHSSASSRLWYPLLALQVSFSPEVSLGGVFSVWRSLADLAAALLACRVQCCRLHSPTNLLHIPAAKGSCQLPTSPIFVRTLGGSKISLLEITKTCKLTTERSCSKCRWVTSCIAYPGAESTGEAPGEWGIPLHCCQHTKW